MKKVLSISNAPKSFDVILLLTRIAIAAMMLAHGLPKMGMLFAGGDVKFASIFGMGAEISLALAVFAEVFCSILVMVGFGTRLAVVPLIITMGIAVFYIHASDPFSKQELALHYILVYILLLFAGSGRYSIDGVLYKYHRETAKITYK